MWPPYHVNVLYSVSHTVHFLLLFNPLRVKFATELWRLCAVYRFAGLDSQSFERIFFYPEFDLLEKWEESWN